MQGLCRAVWYATATEIQLKTTRGNADMSKDGLCAIVTGSASGLGAATAAILAKGGARVVVNYSNSKTEAEATADLCRTAGADVVVVQGDVSRDEDCKKIAAAAAPFGRLDILVNNAGTKIGRAHV
jgi:3-oxoacyl-[acyl-carrier protein] reductase